MTFKIWLAIWIFLCFVVAFGAENRGRSFAKYLVLSIFLSPLIGGMVLLVLGDDKETIEKNSIEEGISKKCPFCAEIIKKDAIICRFCGRDLANIDDVSYSDSDDKWYCEECGTENPTTSKECIKCGAKKVKILI